LGRGGRTDFEYVSELPWAGKSAVYSGGRQENNSANNGHSIMPQRAAEDRLRFREKCVHIPLKLCGLLCVDEMSALIEFLESSAWQIICQQLHLFDADCSFAFAYG
jgi:hypothetical protein